MSDFSAIVTDPTALNNNGEKRNLVNSVVCEHFLRQGMLDIAENLIKVILRQHYELVRTQLQETSPYSLLKIQTYDK